jgi:hemerythrin
VITAPLCLRDRNPPAYRYLPAEFLWYACKALLQRREAEMSIAWKKEFAIGVREIDSQHQELFARLNRLSEAIEAGKGTADLATIFQFLDDYVVRHFRAEEDLQKRNRYPHFAMHSAEHCRFLLELERLKQRLAKEGPSDALVHLTTNVLGQWLIQHIGRLDKALAGYLAQHKTEEWERWLRNNF